MSVLGFTPESYVRPLSTRRPVQEGHNRRSIFKQKVIIEGHFQSEGYFQPEGQYQKVTFPEGHTPWRQTPPKEHGTRQADKKWHTPVNRQTSMKMLPSHNFICRWYLDLFTRKHSSRMHTTHLCQLHVLQRYQHQFEQVSSHGNQMSLVGWGGSLSSNVPCPGRGLYNDIKCNIGNGQMGSSSLWREWRTDTI